MTDHQNKQWTTKDTAVLFELPLMSLLHQAQSVHQQHFTANELQLSTLLSIKTGACPEDCAYCPQSGHYNTEVEKEKLLSPELVLQQAKTAKAKGATRFCMGAAWRSPPAKEFPKILAMVAAVKAEGMETCMTLGMLNKQQAQALKESGLDYYNHNLDTSPEYYKKIISTRCYQDRLDTLQEVRDAGINVCCGGILGMGETREDRMELLCQLANLEKAPESVPINQLMPIPGTPLADAKKISNFEFIRTIAVARIMMPSSVLRLSAGRENMSDEMQALCFLAGIGSIFIGDVLLTAPNPHEHKDMQLINALGMIPQTV